MNINASINHRDLDALSGVGCSTADLPGLNSVYQPQIRIVNRRRISHLVLGIFDQGAALQGGQAGAVELHGNRVEREVKLPRDLCGRRVILQPILELVAFARQQSAIGFHRVAIKVYFLAVRRLGPDGGAQRSGREQDHGAGVVLVARIAGGRSVSRWRRLRDRQQRRCQQYDGKGDIEWCFHDVLGMTPG